MPLLPPPYTPHKPSSTPGRSLSTKPSSRSRSISIRGRTRDTSTSSAIAPPRKYRFTLASLRGNYQPELSRRLFRLIKSENYVINSYEAAGHERQSVATQLSEWGEQSGDDAISELSDKLGVLLTELGTQEEAFAQNLEEYRSMLKQIRNTESSVQPSRNHKAKVNDEINRLRYKEPNSTRITVLEQELVRAEAENLVAEAQLINVTRSKLKEAFAAQFVAVIERADKQTVLARHGLRMLNLLDDTPVTPGETLPLFEHESEARQILLDAEEELRDWTLNIQEEVTTNAHAVTGGVVDGVAAANASSSAVVHATPMPVQRTATTPPVQRTTTTPPIARSVTPSPPSGKSASPPSHLIHPAHRQVSSGSVGSSSGGSSSGGGYGDCGNAPYPLTDSERAMAAEKAAVRRKQSMLAVA